MVTDVPVKTAVLILNGNSEISGHVRRHLCHLIFYRHLNRSRSDFFSPTRPILFSACTACFEVPSNISTRLKTSVAQLYPVIRSRTKKNTGLYFDFKGLLNIARFI